LVKILNETSTEARSLDTCRQFDGPGNASRQRAGPAPLFLAVQDAGHNRLGKRELFETIDVSILTGFSNGSPI
jgi:hypothetical protein